MLASDGLVLRFVEPIDHDDVRGSIAVDRVLQVGEQIGVKAELSGGITKTQVVQELLDGIFRNGARSHELALTPGEEEAPTEQVEKLKQAWTQVDGGMLTLWLGAAGFDRLR